MKERLVPIYATVRSHNYDCDRNWLDSENQELRYLGRFPEGKFTEVKATFESSFSRINQVLESSRNMDMNYIQYEPVNVFIG